MGEGRFIHRDLASRAWRITRASPRLVRSSDLETSDVLHQGAGLESIFVHVPRDPTVARTFGVHIGLCVATADRSRRRKHCQCPHTPTHLEIDLCNSNPQRVQLPRHPELCLREHGVQLRTWGARAPRKPSALCPRSLSAGRMRGRTEGGAAPGLRTTPSSRPLDAPRPSAVAARRDRASDPLPFPARTVRPLRGTSQGQARS